MNINVEINKLKNISNQMNLVYEKNNINVDSGYVEFDLIDDNTLQFKISNVDYYFETLIEVNTNDRNENENFNCVVEADKFISLISKFDNEMAIIRMNENVLIINTNKNEYTFPIIKENGNKKHLTKINFNDNNCNVSTINSKDLISVSTANAQGLLNATFKKDIQQFVYVDNNGAITFTDNLYVNDFKNKIDGEFKFLVNVAQAKLFNVFSKYDDVVIKTEKNDDENANIKIKLIDKNNTTTLILIMPSMSKTNTFPATKIRGFVSGVNDVHVIIDKNKLEKALSRLMIFDKKFDITVLDYSKFVFGENELKLISIKNHNYEIIPYNSSTNAVKYEAVIRFADMINQLKAIDSNIIDVSYGNGIIVINSNIKQVIKEPIVVNH